MNTTVPLMTQTVFLSYARANGEFALRLSRDLASAGVDIWVDQLAIAPGKPWDNAVQEALESCATVLVILSPEAVASRSVMDEISYALDQNKRMVPVLYRPCKIPFRLGRIQHIDFTTDYAAGLVVLNRVFSGDPDPAPLPTTWWGRLAEIYHRRPVQRATMVMVLAAVAFLQYYLVHMPISDLNQTTKFSPAIVKATEQVVSFKNPESDPGKFEFGFDQPAESQKQRMLVDAYFDHASLSGETLHKLGSFGVHAPPDAAAISYLTTSDGGGSCNTAVRVQTEGVQTESAQTEGVPTQGVKTKGLTEQARSAEFSQGELAPSDRHRLLEMKMKGLDSTVTLSSEGTFGDADLAMSSCKVTLNVGDWQQITRGFIPIVVKVPAGSGYRLHWEAADVKTRGWSTGGRAVTLLAFGQAHRQDFHAEEIGVFATQPAEQDRAHNGLVAQARQKGAPLTVDSLMIGTDHLQFAASGKARVLENGRAIVTVNFLDAINKYPLFATLFGLANLGLLNWARRGFFPPRRATFAEVVPFPNDDGAVARTSRSSQL